MSLNVVQMDAEKRKLERRSYYCNVGWNAEIANSGRSETCEGDRASKDSMQKLLKEEPNNFTAQEAENL